MVCFQNLHEWSWKLKCLGRICVYAKKEIITMHFCTNLLGIVFGWLVLLRLKRNTILKVEPCHQCHRDTLHINDRSLYNEVDYEIVQKMIINHMNPIFTHYFLCILRNANLATILAQESLPVQGEQIINEWDTNKIAKGKIYALLSGAGFI